MRYSKVTKLLLLLLILRIIPLCAKEYSIKGHVIDQDGQPVAFASVLAGPVLGTYTDENGWFLFQKLDTSQVNLIVQHIGYTHKSVVVSLPLNKDYLEVTIRRSILKMPGVTVSVSSNPEAVINSVRTVTVISQEDIEENASQSMAGLLKLVPGVQLLEQGAQVAKPVIRGMTNQRIVILMDGVRLESQQWGDHHTPELSATGAEKIEVLRGPASLIYGPAAVGGVVNVISPELITGDEGADQISGDTEVSVFSNNKQYITAANIHGAGSFYAWQLHAKRQQSDNIGVPGGESFLIERDNTSYEQTDLKATGTVVLDSVQIKMEASRFKEVQTLLGEGHWHNTGGGVDGTEPWYHDMGYIQSPTLHQRYSASAKIPVNIHKVIVQFSKQYNHRRGIPEGEEAQVNLKANTWIGDMKFHHFFSSKFPGTAGFSVKYKADETLGPEVLIPDADDLNIGAFIFQKINLNSMRFEAGGRIDWNQLDVHKTDFSSDYTIPDTLIQRSPVFSGSFGAVWHEHTSPWSVAANIGTGWRPPTSSELFIRGVHHAEYRYELGAPDLTVEKSITSDLTFRLTDEHIVSELTLYFNAMNNYIYASPLGTFDTEITIPIYQIKQGDAQIRGIEFHSQYEIFQQFCVQAGYDCVRGMLTGTVSDADGDGKVEKFLPNMPADRLLGGARFCLGDVAFFEHMHMSVQGEYYFNQNRLAEFENILGVDADDDGGLDTIDSEGYFLLNLSLNTHVHLKHSKINITTGINNVLNKAYYSHLSKYKGLVYNQGFDAYMKLNYEF